MSEKIKYKNFSDLIEKCGLQKYKVNDLNIDTASVIFVLESPHTGEVEAKYPVAGSSGRAITKTLFPNEKDFKALGKLLYDEKDTEQDNRLKNIGIMNISQIPLQMSAYLCEDIQNNCELFRLLGLIRNNPKERKHNKQLNLIISIIKNDFEKRIENLTPQKIILCGDFVQEIFESIFEFDSNIHFNVPHPSYGNWSKEKYTSEITILKDLVNDKTS